MNNLGASERIIYLLFILSETNSQTGSVDVQEGRTYIFTQSFIALLCNSSSSIHMAG